MLVGDPGIGKTALIGDFLDNEWPFRLRTLRVDGFAAEADLPYAGIDRLVLDLHDQIASLRKDWRELSAWQPVGRWVCLPTNIRSVWRSSHYWALPTSPWCALSMMRTCLTRPEPAALVALAGLEVVQIGGLDTLSAIELLNAQRVHRLDPHLAVKVVEQLGGHPLAIAELANHADLERLARRALSLEPLPLVSSSRVSTETRSIRCRRTRGISRSSRLRTRRETPTWFVWVRLKDIRSGALIDAIRRAAAGSTIQSTDVLRRGASALRPSLQEAHATAVPDLTMRESQVLDLITGGLTNREIGARLGLAEKTVKNYVSGLLAKLGMERRTQAAVYGAELKHTAL